MLLILKPITFCLSACYLHVHEVVVRDKAVNLTFVKFCLALKKRRQKDLQVLCAVIKLITIIQY